MPGEYGFSVNVGGASIVQMKEIELAIAKMGLRADVETKKVGASFATMGEGIAETFRNLKGLLLTGLGITALFEGWEFIENSKVAFEALEKAVVRVDMVIKSTHFAAGFSSNDIENQAKELSKGIVNKRDEILDAQGMLLSFHDIRGGKFKETMQSVADFATFYKENMTQAAMQVGKAVNDPLRGMTRLQRMGVEFSDQQKQQIKNYIAQGNLLGAQEIILKELRTEFGGQAKGFATTDAGKIQLASKQWEELQFKIGEVISRVEVSLIPAFGKLVASIKHAFSSTIIQFFIEHLKDLVSIVLKLLPIWIAYKAVMIANELITSVFAIKNGILTASMGELTVMTDGATWAFEGFGAAIVATGIGALVVGIGLLIEKLISMNEELDATIDKKYKLDDSKDFFREQGSQFESLKERMGEFQNLGKQGQQELMHDVQSYIKANQEKMPILNSREKTLDSEAHKGYGKDNGVKAFLGSNLLKSLTDSTYRTGFHTVQASKSMSSGMKDLSKNFTQAKNYLKTLTEKGITDIKPGGVSGVTQSAINMSQLSGASGGLGEAKVINIHIDTIQKIGSVQGGDLDKAAKKAVEEIIRTINNLAYSQSSY